MKHKIKSFGTKFFTKMTAMKLALSMALISAMTSPLTVSAAGLAEKNSSSDAGSIVATIAGVIVNIFPLVGVFFVISGVFKLVMAYRNDQPEAQTAAAKDIVIGAVFIVFRAFIWNSIATAIGIT